MFAAVTVLAAGGGPSAVWQVLGPIIVAALAIPGAVYTARATLRASNTTNTIAQAKNDNDRDAALDARVDAVNARLWERVDAQEALIVALRAERDLLAERHARLRLALIGLGLDPDAAPPPAHQLPPAPAGGTTATPGAAA